MRQAECRIAISVDGRGWCQKGRGHGYLIKLIAVFQKRLVIPGLPVIYVARTLVIKNSHYLVRWQFVCLYQVKIK